MKFFITGANGFVGSHLVNQLLAAGHEVTAVGRSPAKGTNPENFAYLQADTTQAGAWQKTVATVDAVINLAGANIFKRWTAAYKKKIYDSRILTTRNLVAALPDTGKVLLCSTSAAGYYGDRAEEVLTENSLPGDDFLARVCIDWEKEAFQAEEKGCRVVTTRFGVVLGKGGGALATMRPAYKMGLGGKLGHGRQWFPWICLPDLIAAIRFVVDMENLQGPVNFTAPHPVRNAEFNRALADRLRRPAFWRVPKFALDLAAGELGALVLNSQRAIPEKLTAAGFQFSYPKLSSALEVVV